MKIIIVGCGKVGTNIAEELAQEKHDLVIFDKHSIIVQELSNSLDALGVIGDAGSLSDLKEAGVENSDLLLAVTSSDETNMLCCLFARKLNPNIRTIARVRNPIYSIKEVNYIKNELGLTSVINPEMATAREIFRALRLPQAMKVETFSRGRVELITFAVEEGNSLENKFVKDVSRDFNSKVIFVGIERNDEIIIPHGDTQILKDDKLSIIAETSEMIKFFNQTGLHKNPIKSVFMCGGSAIATYLASMLLRAGIKVKIVEREKEKCDQLADRLPEATIIWGDATNNNLLLEEGVNDADAFISLTNVDEENVMLSLFARSLKDMKVVTKVNHIAYDSVMSKLDVGSIVYPKYITADYILSYVRGLSNAASSANITALYRILNNKAEAMTFKINSESLITSKKLKDISFIDNLLICSIIRNDEVITPSGDDTIEVGDIVLIVTSNIGIDSIEGIIK